jgi:hypothetical protein
MKHKTTFKDIEVSPYVVRVWLIITDNPHHECWRMNRRYKGLDISWHDGAAAQTEYEFYQGNILVVIFDANQKYDVNTIAHEVVHIKNAVFRHSGMEHDPDNDEPEAYLSGWIAGKISEAWMEYKKS